MSKHGHSNVFRKSAELHEIFGFWQKKQVVTLKEMIAFGISIGKSADRAYWDARTILSPRLKARVGKDNRGSVNTYGHLYYAEKLNRPVVLGVKTPMRFRLRWRNVPLKSRREEVKVKIEQQVEAIDRRLRGRLLRQLRAASKATVTA